MIQEAAAPATRVPVTPGQATPAQLTPALVAQELRALALTGLAYGQNPYDVDRFRRILALSAELAAAGQPVTGPEIRRAYLQNLAHVTPLLAVEAVVVRSERVLLIRRTDTGLWGLPGGMAEVGETPAGGAERELFEETGLRGRAVKLLGVLDARYAPNRHGLHLVAPIFLLEADGEPRPTLEASEVAFYDWDALPPLHPGHERSLAVAHEALRTGQPFFDPEPERDLHAQGLPGPEGPGAAPVRRARTQSGYWKASYWKVGLARLLTRGGGWLLLQRPHMKNPATPEGRPD